MLRISSEYRFERDYATFLMRGLRLSLKRPNTRVKPKQVLLKVGELEPHRATCVRLCLESLYRCFYLKLLDALTVKNIMFPVA